MHARESLLFIVVLMMLCVLLSFSCSVASWAQVSPRARISNQGRSARFLVDQGLRQYEKKRYWKAVKYFSAAIRKRPDYAAAHRLRGLTYQRLGLYAAAVKDFSRYIELSPSRARGYLLRGDARLFSNDMEGAARDFTKALALSPGSAEAYMGRGLALTGLQKYKAAEKDYFKALKLNPRNGDALANLGRTYMLAGKPKLALRCLERAQSMVTGRAWKRQVARWIATIRKQLGLAELDSSLPVPRGTRKPLW